MPDLREELGRLADAVGEPVSFRDLHVTRRRRERRRRSASGIVALVVVVSVGAFFAATYRTKPVLPEAPPTGQPSPHATAPSGHSSPLQHDGPRDPRPPIVPPRCLSGLQIVGNGSQLATCGYLPAGTPLTVTFTIVGSATMKLALYPRLGCSEYGCDRTPLWRGKAFSGPGQTTLRIPGLRFGRYVLLDRLHPATARTVLIVG